MKLLSFFHVATSLIMVSLTSSFVSAGLGADPEEFFKPGPTAPDTLPADRLYPAGQMFLFTFFSLGAEDRDGVHQAKEETEIQKDFQRYKEAGFQIFGPQHEMNNRAIKDAAEHGLKTGYIVTYRDGRLFLRNEPVSIDPEEVYQEISRQVKEVAEHEEIAFWYLQPGELRPWRKQEMEFLEAAARAIHESDPLKRPLWTYDPNHANAERMTKTTQYSDLISKGMYTNYAGMENSRIWCRWTIEQQMEALRKNNSDAVPVALCEMYYDGRRPPMTPEMIASIPTWVQHDTYLAFITGAKGVIVFSLRERPSLPEPAWEAYFNAYAKLADELLGELNLAKVLLFGEVRQNLLVDIIEGTKEVEMVFPSGGVKEPVRYPSVSHRELVYGTERYLFLANSAETPVRLMVGGFPYAAARAQSLLDHGTAFDVGEGEFEVELAPLEVQVYRITRP